jgi:ATP-binding cassette subfamily F protein 3
MSLVVASGLSLAHGPKVLFHEAGFSIGPRDRIGLVGANGTGKSSLLRMLSGEVSPDSGNITFRRGARAGYLPQELAALPGGPLVDAVLASVPGRGASTGSCRRRCARDRSRRAAQLAQSPTFTRSSPPEERHGHQAERILSGLGFGEAELSDTDVLRGGGCAALAGSSSGRLLDEPRITDVPTLTWFDDFLRASGKALLLISHDREFLDRQISRVFALEPEGLRSYTGDYDDYRRQRAEEEDRLAAAARRQDSRKAELREFIDASAPRRPRRGKRRASGRCRAHGVGRGPRAARHPLFSSRRPSLRARGAAPGRDPSVRRGRSTGSSRRRC